MRWLEWTFCWGDLWTQRVSPPNGKKQTPWLNKKAERGNKSISLKRGPSRSCILFITPCLLSIHFLTSTGDDMGLPLCLVCFLYLKFLLFTSLQTLSICQWVLPFLFFSLTFCFHVLFNEMPSLGTIPIIWTYSFITYYFQYYCVACGMLSPPRHGGLLVRTVTHLVNTEFPWYSRLNVASSFSSQIHHHRSILHGLHHRLLDQDGSLLSCRDHGEKWKTELIRSN